MSNPSLLHTLKNHYRMRRVGELAVLSIGGALLAFGLSAYLISSAMLSMILAGSVGLILFMGRFFQLQLHRLTDLDIATFLNRNFTELEDSTDLLAATPQELAPLQQLQRQRLLTAFESASQKVQWPQQWSMSLVVLAIGLGAFGFLRAGFLQQDVQAIKTNGSVTEPAEIFESVPTPVEISGTSIMARPPAYTGLKTMTTKDFNLKLPEGSLVTWQLEFSGKPTEVMMFFSDGDSTALTFSKDTFTLYKPISQSGFYQLSWLDRGKIKSSDYYKLEVVEDQIPQVAISNQEQFVELPWNVETNVQVTSSLSDDYGLTEAYVIATVSKGNGESVKFREERLPFVRPKLFAGKKAQAFLELNTRKLGMEPGDELYYYVEAWDNHSPQKQSNRTETHFIKLQDTVTQVISFEGGLGVDLMPEYFRSQRQIIIDSEKLLTEKSAIAKKAFATRSNDLAYDQKVLRLRYGQFLGEEFESGLTAEPEVEEETVPENEEDAVKQYGHAHDTDNEHNLVETHDHEQDENHHPGEEEESPIEAFAHSHDNMEEATFFVQSVKAKLRAALSMMWDAELHLRMNDPAQSLPYQYKILKLLKEISNDSRIYVHRTGFDAPPLKEEKRLTGTLDEVKNSQASYVRSEDEVYPAIREALPLIERLLQKKGAVLVASENKMLAAAGNELAAAAIEQPDVYLQSLTALKSIIDGDFKKTNLLMVREAFWRLLPQLPRSAGRSRRTGHELQNAFIQQLKAQSN